MSVRYDGNHATVEVRLDGEPHLRWTGPARSLRPQAEWLATRSRQPGLETVGTAVTFHLARLRVVSGSADLLASDRSPARRTDLPSAAVPTEFAPVGEEIQLDQWIDLLTRVDLSADGQRGLWQRSAEGLVGRAAQPSAVGFPLVVHGAYELEVQFTRQTGDDAVALGLPVGWQSGTSRIECLCRPSLGTEYH